MLERGGMRGEGGEIGTGERRWDEGLEDACVWCLDTCAVCVLQFEACSTHTLEAARCVLAAAVGTGALTTLIDICTNRHLVFAPSKNPIKLPCNTEKTNIVTKEHFIMVQ